MKRIALWSAAATPVAAACAAMYLPAVKLGFFSDDFWFLEMLHTKGPLSLLRIFTYFMYGAYFRPAAAFPWMVDHWIGGTGYQVYHVTNVLLHLLNASLLSCWLIRLSGSRHAGLIAGLLFLFHPVQAEAVFWTSGRFDVLCLTFMLAFLILYEGHMRSPTCGRLIGLGMFGGLAMLSKETGMAILGMAAVMELVRVWKRGGMKGMIREETGEGPASSPFRRILCLAVVLIVYAILRILTYRLLYIPGPSGVSAPANILDRLVISLSHLMVPAWPVDEFAAILPWLKLLMVVIPVAALAISIFRPPRLVLLIPGVALIIFSIAPALLLPWVAGEMIGSRVLYIPSAGLCMVLGIMFAGPDSRSPKPWLNRVAITAAIILAIAFVVQLRLNLSPFMNARDMIHTVLDEVKAGSEDAREKASLYLMNFPRSRDGVMLFFNDLALLSALNLQAQAAGKKKWLEAYHAGRVGPCEDRFKFPASSRLLEGKARVYKWDMSTSMLNDITGNMKSAVEKRIQLVLEVSSRLAPLELVSDGKLVGLFPGPELIKDKNTGMFVPGSNDPYLESGIITLNPLLVDRIELKMAISPMENSEENLFGQVFWRDSRAEGFSQEASIIFSVIPDGQSHIYKLPLNLHPGFFLLDKIIQLRLDPVNEIGRFKLEYFSIIPVASGQAL
jgi:hypothetical protein